MERESKVTPMVFTREEIMRRCVQIIGDQIGVGVGEGTVLPTNKIMDDLGADSLDVVELVMSLEEEFDLSITDDEAMKCTTVDDVVNGLWGRLGKGME